MNPRSLGGLLGVVTALTACKPHGSSNAHPSGTSSATPALSAPQLAVPSVTAAPSTSAAPPLPSGVSTIHATARWKQPCPTASIGTTTESACIISASRISATQ